MYCSKFLVGLAFLILLLVRHAHAELYLIAGSEDANSPDGAVRISDVRTKLQGTGVLAGDIHTYNLESGTPSLSELRSYDAVLVWANSIPDDAAALGNVLADYVDSGGGVVEMSFGFDFGIGGRWKSENYSVSPAAGFASGDSLTLATVYLPHHPILAGVNSFDGGSGSFHNGIESLNPGATLVADWSDGDHLIAVNTDSFAGRTAGLNFYPVSNSVEAFFWDSNTDGDLLMANAMGYVSAVPEPSSLVLFVSCGVALLGGYRYRRRRAL